jgi:hypothetical protein
MSQCNSQDHCRTEATSLFNALPAFYRFWTCGQTEFDLRFGHEQNCNFTSESSQQSPVVSEEGSASPQKTSGETDLGFWFLKRRKLRRAARHRRCPALRSQRGNFAVK